MISDLGPIILRSLQTIFIKTWSSGNVPSVWKNEHKIYIPKPDKWIIILKNAYRGLSLTSIVGKLMDRMVKTRLLALRLDAVW